MKHAFLLLSFLVAMIFLGPSVALAGNRLSGCGGDGQRACCASTFEVAFGGACDSDNVEVAGCQGDCTCGGANPFGLIKASGTCRATVACGDEAQRACCIGVFEKTYACGPALVQIPGCSGNCLCGPPGTGQLSAGICVQSTPCGGEGQRACCAVPLEPRRIELGGLPCEKNLVEFPGCTGDCTCGTDLLAGKSSGTCTRGEAISEPGTDWTASATPPACPLRGFADLHVHLNAHLAHGDRVFAGKPAPLDGSGRFTLDPAAGMTINAALSPIDDRAIHRDHGLFDDIVGFGTRDGSQANFGAPSFSGWPTWHTTTHQQVYYAWLERAFRGGLRLMVMHAVTNEALCRATQPAAEREAKCNHSMPAIDRQLHAAYDFQRFIDEQCRLKPGSGFCAGNPATGWFRIVTTPLEARQVIRDGKLAVVLAIEVDNLFNCKKSGPCPDGLVDDSGQPITTIEAAVDYYHGLGVRHILPIHNFDNAFGGPATWQDPINVGNRAVEGEWWNTVDCPTVDGKKFGYITPNDLFSAIKAALASLFGFGNEPIPARRPDRPRAATCVVSATRARSSWKS
jgi:hypothetical protein